MAEPAKEPMKSVETAKATVENLTPEQKEGQVRRALWAEGMRLLNEKGVNYSSLKSSEGNCVWVAVAKGDYIEKDSDYGNRGIDLKIEVLRRKFDESKGLHRAPIIEIFLFNPDKRVGVLKEIYEYPNFEKGEATSHSRKIESRQATVEELEDLLKNVRASTEEEVKTKENQDPSQAGQELPASLGLEAKEEAKKMARKVWAKCMELSQGKEWMGSIRGGGDSEALTIKITGNKNLLKPSDAYTGARLALAVKLYKGEDPISSRVRGDVEFYFYGEMGEDIVEKIIPKPWDLHEATGSELQDLLNSIENCAVGMGGVRQNQEQER